MAKTTYSSKEFKSHNKSDKPDTIFKKENDIKDSHTVFLMFAWSPYIKGVDVAVKAFLNLTEEEKEKVRFIIVHGRGDGYLKCIDYLADKLGNKDF